MKFGLLIAVLALGLTPAFAKDVTVDQGTRVVVQGTPFSYDYFQATRVCDDLADQIQKGAVELEKTSPGFNEKDLLISPFIRMGYDTIPPQPGPFPGNNYPYPYNYNRYSCWIALKSVNKTFDIRVGRYYEKLMNGGTCADAFDHLFEGKKLVFKDTYARKTWFKKRPKCSADYIEILTK